MENLLNGMIIALSAWFITVQIPYKEVWMPHLYVLDAALFAGLIWLVTQAPSTSIVISTAYAGVVFTLLLRITRFVWRRRRHI